MDEVDWSSRELGRLLTDHIHEPEVAATLTRLRGTWPFNATSHCQSTNTRDTAYRQLAGQGFHVIIIISSFVQQSIISDNNKPIQLQQS